MDKFKLFHLRTNELKLANLAGLADETLFVVEPQVSLLGDVGTKSVARLRAVNTEPVQETLVTLFNKTNDVRKKYSALSPAKINLAGAVTEPLPTHTYTGKAITPIPVLYYEGKELTFAVDFSLTYKNNVEVGEATVIMHGKGRFNGQHIRKFNIARTV
jgi:hypothetical protein